MGVGVNMILATVPNLSERRLWLIFCGIDDQLHPQISIAYFFLPLPSFLPFYITFFRFSLILCFNFIFTFLFSFNIFLWLLLHFFLPSLPFNRLFLVSVFFLCRAYPPPPTPQFHSLFPPAFCISHSPSLFFLPIFFFFHSSFLSGVLSFSLALRFNFFALNISHLLRSKSISLLNYIVFFWTVPYCFLSPILFLFPSFLSLLHQFQLLASMVFLLQETQIKRRRHWPEFELCAVNVLCMIF